MPKFKSSRREVPLCKECGQPITKGKIVKGMHKACYQKNYFQGYDRGKGIPSSVTMSDEEFAARLRRMGQRFGIV